MISRMVHFMFSAALYYCSLVNYQYIINLPDPGSLLNSQVVNDCLNPVWNQTFDFVVEDGLHDMLMVEVYDHDTFGKVKYLHRLFNYLPRLPHF